MSQLVKDRPPQKLTVLTKAEALCTHTLKIIGNPNNFGDQCPVLKDRIAESAINIYMDSIHANEIRVGNDPVLKEKRLGLQNSAINNCDDLFKYIQLAIPIFHIKARRVEFWTGLLFEVKRLLIAWRKSNSL